MMKALGAANRGSLLEEALRQSNATYRARGVAFVTKVPNPWVPVGGEVVTDQYGRRRWLPGRAVPTTKEDDAVDFIGQWKDHGGLAYEAKECAHERYFPLANVTERQVRVLSDYARTGGYAFLIIYMAVTDEAYVLPIQAFLRYWKAAGRDNPYRKPGSKRGKQHIPLADLQEWPVIRPGAGLLMDYLPAVEEAFSQLEEDDHLRC